jgi:L-arabinose transport system substrate-binding protein
MQRALALSVAVLVACTLVAGCGHGDDTGGGGKGATATSPSASGSNSGGDLKLGFVVKQPEEPWFQLEWQFADEAARKYGFELIKLGAADGGKAMSQIDNLASSGAKGFVICTPDVKLGPAILNAAKQNDLKLIAVDDRFQNPDGSPMTEVHYLGISATKIGNMVGQALWDEMKRRNWSMEETALCAVTFEELPTARERTDGAIETLTTAGFSKDKVYKAPQKTSDVEGGLNAVTVLLTQHPDVKRWLICGMNDSAVLGAVRAMEGRQIPAESTIGIGINGTDCIAEFKKAQTTGFFASVLLSARQHGFQTAEMLYKWVHDGVEPPLDTRTTGVLINRDNFKQVLAEQGIKND